MELLISYGADQNKPDSDGSTPIMRAAFLGHESVTKLLLRELRDFEVCAALSLPGSLCVGCGVRAAAASCLGRCKCAHRSRLEPCAVCGFDSRAVRPLRCYGRAGEVGRSTARAVDRLRCTAVVRSPPLQA